MGKYIKKEKIKRKVKAMEISIGVRTRAKAKTLALKNSKKSSIKILKNSPSSNSSSSSTKASSCYLQLRSRRLERCLEMKNSKKENPRIETPKIANSASICSPIESRKSSKLDNEVSFGENFGEFEGRSSSNSRETTPCSLIRRDSDVIGTPGSTTRPARTAASKKMNQRAPQRNVPATHEMEDFFAVPEKRQQKEFVEKYNFDPVKDCPIPGRYEWIKLRN